MENQCNSDRVAAPANKRPEYVILNRRVYTNGDMDSATILRSGVSQSDMMTVVAAQEAQTADGNPGYVVLNRVVYYRCGGLDPARIVDDPRTQIVIAAPHQIDYQHRITVAAATAIPTTRPRPAYIPASRLDPATLSQAGRYKEEDDDSEEGNQEEEGDHEEEDKTWYGWLPEHHDYLFDGIIEPWITRHQRKPTHAEFEGFTNALYQRFCDTWVYKGQQLLCPNAESRVSSRTFPFPSRSFHNVHCYVTRTWKQKYWDLRVRILGPGGGNKVPKQRPNPNRDQRKDKSVPRPPKKEPGGGRGGGQGGIGSMWNMPL